MKYLAILSLYLIFAMSCSKKEDDVNEGLDIAGSWTLKSYEMPILDLDNNGIPSTNLLTELPCYKFDLNFTKDGKASYTKTDIDPSLTPAICVKPTKTFNGVFQFKGNEIKLYKGTSLLDVKEKNLQDIGFEAIGEDVIIRSDDFDNLGRVTIIFKRK